MPRSYLDPPCPIAALATAPGEAALAVIRCSGPGSVEGAARLLSRPGALLEARGHSLVLGELVDPGTGQAIDQVLVAVYRSPHSPTGEDQVEFSCHGSPAVVRRALALLEANGFAPALPGEFSFRAFCNGKTDLVRAEAVDELVRARSEAAREGALARLEGGLSARLGEARASLLAAIAEVELRLDYGEDEAEGLPTLDGLPYLRAGLAALSASFASTRLLSQGFRVALAGAPNAGKSRLFNLFLREERSIVSPEPGTTRDWVEAELEVEGLRLRLLDTAGLREAEGAIESEGVRRSERLVGEAELVLHIVDSTRAVQGPVPVLAGRPDAIGVWNKVDLAGSAPLPRGFLPVSAATGEGFAALAATLAERARSLTGSETGRVARHSPWLANERQKSLLDRALSAILRAEEVQAGGIGLDALAVELREAADALGEITGEISTPEVLESIFSRFCVGK
jgi:tRNA modification GTPase